MAAQLTTVVGLGDPVMDVLYCVSHEWLRDVAEKPGGCNNVSEAEQSELMQRASEHCDACVPGGSAANVLKGLANLSAGRVRCRFVGMVGTDTAAAEYEEMLRQQGVEPMLLKGGSGPTASCLCFVTPDGQRTMRTCLGAAAQLLTAGQLPADWAAGAALLHCEGYCLYRPELAAQAMAAARAAGAAVSLDLASFECVAACKDALLKLLSDGLVDLVFANEEEALALLEQLPVVADSDVSGSVPPLSSTAATTSSAEERVAQAQAFVLRHARACVVSLGARGCVVRAADGGHGSSPAGGVKVVDTIGAGDYFTSGFLFAYLQGCSLDVCAAVGCAAGSEAVQTKGAVLPPHSWERLRGRVAAIISAGAACRGSDDGSGEAGKASGAETLLSNDAAATGKVAVPVA